jgi:aminoglycoside N3'-acetyltransferase
MAGHTPASLTRFCRERLPLILDATNGHRALKTAAEVVTTDRWNSFDRFGDTTDTLVRHYQEAGAEVEVERVQTGGRIGSGRWIIHEAQDVIGASAEVVTPVRKRLLDYSKNPWHVIQWTASTPAEGINTDLVVLDSRQEIEAQPRMGLIGKTVLTSLEPRVIMDLLADRGAVAVISDRPVNNLPDATAWLKFGWGAVPMDHATARLVGLVLSYNQGQSLRRLHAKHPGLRLHIKVDARKYVGHHDVISGLVRGGGDPQDEVWALAHNGEPGAVDNASGVALCVEMARVLEGLIKAGKMPRPKRTIRLLNAYECYGFFPYMENVRRMQTPLAGVCMDTLGSKPEVCDGRMEWHATIPMSAGFVDWVGEAILRATLRRFNPGYRLELAPFMSTADTLAGDPQYGFPCPWLTTHHKKSGSGFDAYHSSGDTLDLLSPGGLKTCGAAMAAYLYYLADAGSTEVVQLAHEETRRSLTHLRANTLEIGQVDYLQQVHKTSIGHLKRWLWGGDRNEILAPLDDGEKAVEQTAKEVKVTSKKTSKKKTQVPAAAKRVVRRTAFLSPDSHNMAPAIARRIQGAGLSSWALFWADGQRSIAEIAALVQWEETGGIGQKAKTKRRSVELDKAVAYFEGHAELGYVELIEPVGMLTKAQLVADLRALGLEKGMDVMVHSSLSRLGYVKGGASTVVDALLTAVGRSGTILAPSFNHRAAQVYNPLTTPTTNGAIADALWRRTEAVRSMHATHAVAAIGPRAKEYCQGHSHIEVGIWESESPIGKLVHDGGYILALGTTHETSTAYHVAEMSVPCGCIDSFGNTDRVVLADGSVQQIQGLAFRAGRCPVALERMDATLDRRKLQRRGKVGQADAEFVRALDLWKVRREHLKKVCPTCTVKPGYR